MRKKLYYIVFFINFKNLKLNLTETNKHCKNCKQKTRVPAPMLMTSFNFWWQLFILIILYIFYFIYLYLSGKFLGSLRIRILQRKALAVIKTKLLLPFLEGGLEVVEEPDQPNTVPYPDSGDLPTPPGPRSHLREVCGKICRLWKRMGGYLHLRLAGVGEIPSLIGRS